jgi:hypothetical protein
MIDGNTVGLVEEKVTALDVSYDELAGMNKSLQKEIEQLNIICKDNSQLAESYSNEILKLQEEQGAHEKLRFDLEKKIEAHLKTEHLLREDIEKSTQLHVENLQGLEETNEDLKKELIMKQNSLEDMTNELEHERNHITELKVDTQSKQEAINQLEHDLKQLQKDKEKDFEEANSYIKEISSQNKELLIKIDHLEDKVQNYKIEYSALLEQMGAQESVDEGMNRQLQKLNGELFDLKEKLNEREVQLMECQNKIIRLESSVEDERSVSEELKKELEILQEKHDYTVNMNSKLSEDILLKTNMFNLNEETINRLKHELQIKLDQEIQLSDSIKKLERDLSNVTIASDDKEQMYHSQCESLKLLLQEKVEANNALENELDAIQKDLVEQQGKWEEQLLEKEGEIKSFKEALENSERLYDDENQALQARIESLESQLPQLTSDEARKELTQQQMDEEQFQQTEDSGVIEENIGDRKRSEAEEDIPFIVTYLMNNVDNKIAEREESCERAELMSELDGFRDRVEVMEEELQSALNRIEELEFVLKEKEDQIEKMEKNDQEKDDKSSKLRSAAIKAKKELDATRKQLSETQTSFEEERKRLQEQVSWAQHELTTKCLSETRRGF